MDENLILQFLTEKFNYIETELKGIKELISLNNINNNNNNNNNNINNNIINELSNDLDESWKEWTKINLRNGVPKDNIFTILLNYNFNYNQIQLFLNWEPTIPFICERKVFQSNILPNNQFTILNHNKTLQDNPKVWKIENNFLDIYKINNFLSCDECRDLIQSFEDEEFEKSTITNSNENDKIRTSSTCHLFPDKNKLYENLNSKICKIIGIDELKGEICQVQKYNIGEEFKEHSDYFDEKLEYNKKYLMEKGQRTWTFMIYLNNVEEGGETNFPKINLKIKPICGMALIWNNLIDDQQVNFYSLHQGLPVIKGEKIIITKWFRQN
jgi:prolyl 4-hydroxylase